MLLLIYKFIRFLFENFDTSNPPLENKSNIPEVHLIPSWLEKRLPIIMTCLIIFLVYRGISMANEIKSLRKTQVPCKDIIPMPYQVTHY